MLSRRRFWIAAAGLLLLLSAGGAQALYTVDLLGMTPVGRDQARQYGWPKGALELPNRPLRAQGWHPFFSECLNDIYH